MIHQKHTPNQLPSKTYPNQKTQPPTKTKKILYPPNKNRTTQQSSSCAMEKFMLIDKSGKTITELNFRGTKIEYLDKLTAKELFLIISATLQTVNKMDNFVAKDILPDKWEDSVYMPILTACENDKKNASRLLSIIVKQALIMSPLPFRHEAGDDQWEAVTFSRV